LLRYELLVRLAMHRTGSPLATAVTHAGPPDMRWPWRRRRGGRVVFIGTSPFDVAQVIASVPTHSPVVSAWVPDEPPPAPQPAPSPALAEITALAAIPGPAAPAENAQVSPNGVQLGFADGSVVTLDDDDPRAIALRAVAARLTGAE
jgi:hypothetical protein